MKKKKIATWVIYLGLLAVISIISAISCGPFEDAQSTVAITPNVKTDACLTGYIRTTPNFCLNNTGQASSSGSLTLDNTCRTATLSNYPSASLQAYVRANLDIRSNNAIAARTLNWIIYNDAGCTEVAFSGGLTIREMAATVAGTALLVENIAIVIPVTSGTFRYVANTTGGTGTGLSFSTMGYYD